MHQILVSSHSGLRWIVLILLVYAILNSLLSVSKNSYEKKDKLINLFSMVFLHVQLVLGLILYFTSPKVVFVEGWMKVPQARFFGLEHILLMVLAIAVVTIGRRKAENAADANAKHKKVALWYTIGLLLILVSIPWPFRDLGVTSWF